jgi:NRPS condensation-like uncharacterized protein
MAEKAKDPIGAWFDIMEELGEYIGIRFGRVPPGTNRPEWFFLRHTDFDGIGGFAELLRQRGVDLPRLAQIRYPSNPSFLWLLRRLPHYLAPQRLPKWRPLPQGPVVNGTPQPPSAVSWHVFDECSTTKIKRACRKNGVTVNSFVFKHLAKAIRPFLADESAVMPWMLPVNLRGKIVRDRDTANYSSYVSVKVRSYETVRDIHRNIYAALASGEHWANWSTYNAGRFLTDGIKRYLISSGKAMLNLGGFSNLGDWDSEKKITQRECEGAWLFAPPVLRCQKLGAGCVTFQNRLSLTVQAHPELTTNPEATQAWMDNWIKEIEMDLSSVLSEPVTMHSFIAAA